MPIASDPYGQFVLDDSWPVDENGDVIKDEAFTNIAAARNVAVVFGLPMPELTYPEALNWIPPSAPREVPHSVTKLQLRSAAIQLGTWSTIKAAINSNEDTKEIWDLTTAVERTHPLVLGLAVAAGWTEEELDMLFILASVS
jgi:hypothetical protein